MKRIIFLRLIVYYILFLNTLNQGINVVYTTEYIFTGCNDTNFYGSDIIEEVCYYVFTKAEIHNISDAYKD